MPRQHFAALSSESGAVVMKAVVRAAHQLKISVETLSAIIGLSEARILRIVVDGAGLKPGTKPFDLAVLLMQLCHSLDAIADGDHEVAARWLASPNAALNDRPIEKLRTMAGLVEVIAYLGARRALV